MGMIKPSVIRSTLVEKLRLISSLTTLLGGTTRIVEHIPTSKNDFFVQAANLNPNHILVGWTGISNVGGDRELYRFHFEIAIRQDQEPSDIIVAIIDGIPTGDSLTLRHMRLFPNLLPMDFDGADLRLVVVSEDRTYSYWQLSFSFVQSNN